MIKGKCHIVGTVLKSYNKIVGRGKIYSLSKHIHDLSPFWLGAGISIKVAELS